MTSSTTKVQKNQQDQTAMILNHQRIRGRRESKSSLMCSPLHKKFPTIISWNPALYPSSRGQSYHHSFKKSLLYPGYIFFFLRNSLMFLYRVPYNQMLHLPRFRFESRPCNLWLVQLTHPLCVSQFFHLENENTDAYPPYSQEEKIFKIFSPVPGWQKYLLDENS